MSYYPICLDLRGKHCVVVGGGSVAERRVERLLGTEADLTIISPVLSDRLRRWHREGLFMHVCRPYQEGDLDGAFVVFAASDDQEVNRQVCEEARRKGILHNVADLPDESDFIVPATLKRGDLLIAISTGGRSPALARHLRLQLEKLVGPEYEGYIHLLGQIRKKLLSREDLSLEEKKALLRGIVESDLLRHWKERDEQAIKETLEGLLEEADALDGLDISTGGSRELSKRMSP